MVGPWQVPVADCAVGLKDYVGYQGEALSIGERTPLAIIDSRAASRMAVGEAVTNLVSSGIDDISRIKLSANWMAAAASPPKTPISSMPSRPRGVPPIARAIPVGIATMRTVWREGEGQASSA
jgi:phosphoribosylformylglycinamidine synthase